MQKTLDEQLIERIRQIDRCTFDVYNFVADLFQLTSTEVHDNLFGAISSGTLFHLAQKLRQEGEREKRKETLSKRLLDCVQQNNDMSPQAFKLAANLLDIIRFRMVGQADEIPDMIDCFVLKLNQIAGDNN